MPWAHEEDWVKDMCVLEAPEETGIYIATLDLDKLRTHRNGDIMGDKYRHPEKYGILCDDTMREERDD